MAKVIPFEQVHIEKKHFTSCRHEYLWFDDKLAELTCKTCKEKINPIWYIGQLATKESYYFRRMKELKEEIKKLEEKKRCKCRHCGKMTSIERL